MAGSTRLELATSGVTGRRSNQLNYDPEDNADWRMLNADWRLRRLSLRRIVIQRLTSAFPVTDWAVQDSNL